MMAFLDVFLKSIGALVVVIGGLWAFTKYIIERGLVPAAELGLDCRVVGEKDEHKIIEVKVHIVNQGSSALVVKDINLVMKTIATDNTLSLYEDDRKFGRLRFPNSLGKDLVKNRALGKEKDENSKSKKSGAFILVPHNTFIQPSVDQEYNFVSTISSNVEYLHIHAEFQYAQKPKVIQKGIVWVSRQLGLIQYSLDHINEPHTFQSVFNVSATA